MLVWDQVKAGAQRTKLQAELASLERDIKERKHAFGAELFNLLEDADTSLLDKTTQLLHLREIRLREPYESAKSEIDALKSRIQKMRIEQIKLEVSRDKETTTVAGTFDKAVNWVTSNAGEAKLEGQVKAAHLEIQRRKELFGVQVYDGFVETGLTDATPALGGGVQNFLRDCLAAPVSMLSEKESRIQDCLDRAKTAITALQRECDQKRGEIQKLG